MASDLDNGPVLSGEQFESLFPFHLAIDEGLTIVRAGRSFRRLCPDVEPGSRLTDGFALKRPILSVNFASLCEAEGTLLLWQRIGSDLTFRGHVLRVAGSDGLLLLWSPWLADTAEIGRYGLAVNDFPLHDPVVDLLHVVKSHTMALADVRKLADKLTAQRAQLRATNAELNHQYDLLKEAQQRLQLKEAETRKLALVASRTDNGVILTDAKGRTEWVNEGFTRMTGYTLDEMLGKTPGEMLQGPATDPATVAEVNAGLRAGQGFRFELLNYHKSGREYWVSVEVQPIRDDSGRVVNFMGIETDVTERRLNAAALEASELRYRSLVSSLREVVFQTDATGCLTFLNDAWTRITGLPLEESLGRALLTFLHPDDRARFRELLSELAAGRGPDSFIEECRLRMYPQRYGWVEFSAHVSVDQTGLTGTLNDVTERRKAAQVMLDAARAAETANRAKSEFLATMSHEIRTPMNGVLGMTELLSYTELRADQRELVETIQTSSTALLRIINDILDFSKVESGTMTFEEENFDLLSLLEDALNVVRPAAQGKGLQLYFDCDPAIGTALRGDAGRLRQVLLNLLSNAVKFTERGDVRLRVVRLNPHRSSITVRFEVLDTGLGIPESQQGSLFQPFSQCDGTPTRKYGGTGLGLAISRKLVQLMGGDIGVESTPGKGSCFWFQLRLEPADDAGNVAPLGLFQQVRTYLAVNDATLRRELETALRSWSVSSQTFGRLDEALGACRSAQKPGGVPGIVLVEPGLLTVTEAHSIRASGCARLVLLTHPGDLPDEHDALDALVDAYLVTPVGRSQLFDCLSSLIARASPAPLPDRPVTAPASPTCYLEPIGADSSEIRLLLVEDNEVNRRVALMMLRKLGYTVDCAADGREAVELVSRRHYDVVLMDCQMPVMDGFQATLEIRGLERADPGERPRTHIIATTANALSGDREQCLAVGMDDYLSKPLSLDKLRDALSRFFAIRETTSSTVTQSLSPRPVADGSEASKPMVDRRVLMGLLEDMGEDAGILLDQVLDVFLADTPSMIEQLRSALTAGDLERIGRVAHRLSGSCAQIGATAMADRSRSVESMVASGNGEEVASMIAFLESDWRATAGEFEDWRRGTGTLGPLRDSAEGLQ